MQSEFPSLDARRQCAVARGINQLHPVYVKSARNAQLTDANGKHYIDFAGGIAALNTGHLHPRVVEAVQAQLGLFAHTCFAVTPYEDYISVCERINRHMPGAFDKRSLLLTTGAEAVESAIKVARAATGRTGVIAFTGAFHGRTFLTMAMTAKVAPYSTAMGLMPGHVYRALFPDGVEVDTQQALASLERIFYCDAAPTDIAAIVIEPVQGEGGFHVAPPAFMAALRALCDKHGILLIADEVQCGAGRTGTFFAMEQMGVDADLIVFGKSVAGGLPLSGVVGRAELMDSIGPGGLGGTYAGNPLACAAALAVLEVIKQERLLEQAVTLGNTLTRALEEITSGLGVSCRIRGLGAMVALELFDDARQSMPATDLTRLLVRLAQQRGLLLLACGPRNNVIRFLMPLTIDTQALADGLSILGQCLEAIKSVSSFV
ncbi:aminotransferase class III-fold pyridoxal phosphate-dependent enzyme [Pseudomonas piscis]|uniref:aminotransferase class III-fold pyridoxal phosphate-dependent enzyme n=1 Tax=Pseudomonas piscis TaxID=2614538 RepID=UPI0021D607A5|nr:aminotransferase class III-fold pyridoxal phosphate-dependent enzyme [Pseudomonas piscis]MCU7650354.1 aminotransferase class III-fold pyridoxal phosphate-dependent enzyme [Pseudomonas piscis]